jgi:hypothetical protein
MIPSRRPPPVVQERCLSTALLERDGPTLAALTLAPELALTPALTLIMARAPASLEGTPPEHPPRLPV